MGRDHPDALAAEQTLYAHRFAREGGQVIVNDINVQGVQDTIQEIMTNGRLAMPGVANVSDKSQVDRFFETVLDHFGTVDVLVNNVGLINVERHCLEADEAWWDRVLAANLKSVFLCSFRTAQVMARRHQGVILNMSSGGATRSHRGMAAYDAFIHPYQEAFFFSKEHKHSILQQS